MACGNPIDSNGIRIVQGKSASLEQTAQITPEELNCDDEKSDEDADKKLSPPLFYLASLVEYATKPFRTIRDYFRRKAEKTAYKTTNSLMRNTGGIDEDSE